MIKLYIIKCEDGYLYTGITADINKRLAEHRNGNCPLTRNKGKINLVYEELFDSRTEAARREKEVKGWKREKKINLISNKSNNIP